jgi:electron transport complex protein RnfC
MANPCIKCGDCQVVCPVDLKPQFLHAAINAENWVQIESLNLEACLFCNACTAACPSEIKLNEQFKRASLELKQFKAKQQKSIQSKIRFEARDARLARKTRLQDAIRVEKLQKASIEDKQAAIAAALARANRKYQDA